MLIVLTGGGTAGHINPALALAEVLIERGHEVRYAGTPQGVESRLVPEAGIEFKAFDAQGFNRKHPLSLVKALTMLAKSAGLAEQWLTEIKPDAVVGFGGYVSTPVGKAAGKLGIPFIVHEQNSVLGLANHELAKIADDVCLTYDIHVDGVSPDRIHVTGNPVRKKVLSASRDEGRVMLGIPDDARMLLVFGGSLGAHTINQALVDLKSELLARDDLYIVHITGPKELDATLEALALTPEEQKRYIVMGYQNRMGETLAAADMIVARSGATSLAEISARAIPALLVPFPFATSDHQTTNAKAYVEAGCAYLVSEVDAGGDKKTIPAELFREKLISLVDNKAVRDAMHDAALAQKTADAATLLADIVVNAATAHTTR